MNNDARSIFEAYKHQSANIQLVNEGMLNRAGARVMGALGSVVGADKQTTKITYMKNIANNKILKLAKEISDDFTKLGIPNQADNFANTHAAMDALPGGMGFFQRLIDWYKDTIEATKNELEQDSTSLSFLSYFNMTADEFARKVIYFGNDYLHPNPESRVQAIRDEIERRLKDQVVPE